MTSEAQRTKEDHNTPDWVLDLVRAYGPIDLDPCSNPWSRVNAGVSISRHAGDDGLSVAWSGSVFVNPPYSRGVISAWVEKAIRERENYRAVGVEVLMLIPATPDTKWFVRAWQTMRMSRCTRPRGNLDAPDRESAWLSRRRGALSHDTKTT